MAKKMTRSDISAFRLQSVIEQLPETFRTTDVSNHPEVQRAAARLLDDPQFHQIVGISLSGKSEQLAIKKIGAQAKATWEKLSDS